MPANHGYERQSKLWKQIPQQVAAYYTLRLASNLKPAFIDILLQIFYIVLHYHIRAGVAYGQSALIGQSGHQKDFIFGEFLWPAAVYI
jgi:hypothetical protein